MDADRLGVGVMARPIAGGCLCGGVRYEIDPPLTYASHCHCSLCRKFHGAATGPYADVGKDQFRLDCGAELLRMYRRVGSGTRTFCRACGSSLFWGPYDDPQAPRFCVAMGTFDDDPGVRPQCHIHVGSRAAWHAITDTLPQYEAWQPEPSS